MIRRYWNVSRLIYMMDRFRLFSNCNQCDIYTYICSCKVMSLCTSKILYISFSITLNGNMSTILLIPYLGIFFIHSLAIDERNSSVGNFHSIFSLSHSSSHSQNVMKVLFHPAWLSFLNKIVFSDRIMGTIISIILRSYPLRYANTSNSFTISSVVKSIFTIFIVLCE